MNVVRNTIIDIYVLGKWWGKDKHIFMNVVRNTIIGIYVVGKRWGKDNN